MAPASTNACALSARRDHTARQWLALRKLSAIGRPMAPSPMKPTRTLGLLYVQGAHTLDHFHHGSRVALSISHTDERIEMLRDQSGLRHGDVQMRRALHHQPQILAMQFRLETRLEVARHHPLTLHFQHATP